MSDGSSIPIKATAAPSSTDMTIGLRSTATKAVSGTRQSWLRSTRSTSISATVNGMMRPFSTVISSAIGSVAAGPNSSVAMGRAMNTLFPKEHAIP